MIYRKLTSTGDYTFGKGNGNFHRDSPATVVQAVMTRLGLIQGEWFLDINYGTPYDSQVLGAGKLASYNRAIQEVILGTPGVRSLVNYSSNVDPGNRMASVSCLIDTIYGQAAVQKNL
jgi:hypothetical protein